MKLATYQWGGRRHVGRLSADGKDIVPLAVPEPGSGMLVLLEALVRGDSLPPQAGASLPLSAVELEAPIPLPRRNIFCAGVNYRAHAREFDTAAALPEHPIIFSKVPDCVIGPGAPIRLPTVSQAIDYEAELAVIIGRPGVAISAARAMDHVWGYTIINDVTARDLQQRHRQWLIGKSLDSFAPMGPWLVSADELDATDTRVRCWVNEELRQDARTSDLIFGIPELIAAISGGITLLPGDIIATGTPAGVGMGFDPPKYLKHGDVVRIEIDGIGVLENPVH